MTARDVCVLITAAGSHAPPKSGLRTDISYEYFRQPSSCCAKALQLEPKAACAPPMRIHLECAMCGCGPRREARRPQATNVPLKKLKIFKLAAPSMLRCWPREYWTWAKTIELNTPRTRTLNRKMCITFP
ncbi:hypothetical protein B0H11DRAFT_2182571 [Mycena galericulata]|nr:hypothetical protein B0H11DRAFT_2182571 [Mycena galericulata]